MPDEQPPKEEVYDFEDMKLNDMTFADLLNKLGIYYGQEFINPVIRGGTINGTSVTRYVRVTAGLFGGDGSDKNLIITSGTTTIDLGGAQIFVKNYENIEISGTGKLAFSNPHANGTLIILKCKGNCILTSVTNPCIDLSGLGSSVGNNGTYILDDNQHYGSNAVYGVLGTTGGLIYSNKNLYSKNEYNLLSKSIYISCGSAGGNGCANGSGVPGGAGGRGGGGLLIECKGDLNFTGTISVAGQTGSTGNNGGANAGSGGGGGGAGGMGVILYSTATATSGTINNAGGVGGTGGPGGNVAPNPGYGGGGGGAYGGAGGLGSPGGGAGGNAGGTSAGGGGGTGGFNGAGFAGGTAGASDGLLIAENKYF